MASAYLSGASLPQIAAVNGRPYDFARRHVLRAGATPRSSAEGVHLAKRVQQDVEVTEELTELIDGLLLGDGHLEATQWSARLTLGQTAAHLPWLQQVHGILTRSGVASTIQVHGRAGQMSVHGKRFRRRRSRALRTARYVFLKAVHARWYPNGVKRVPQDVRLTPLSIAHWYFGDGTVGCRGYHAKFCTDGFSAADVRRLMQALTERFAWAPVLEQRNRILLCKTCDRASLVKMLRSSQVPRCFRHKLRLRLQDRRFVVIGTKEERLRDLRLRELSYGRIAMELKLSKSGVFSACQRLGV